MKSTVLPETFLRYMSKESRAPMGKAGKTLTECNEANAVKLEKELHRQIEGYLRIKGIIPGHARMDRKSTYTTGWPDWVWTWGGKTWHVECKMPGRDLDDEQKEIFENIVANGGNYKIAYRLEDVIELFKTSTDPEPEERTKGPR